MKTGMKKEVVVMNNTKLFFNQEGGEWGKDSRDSRGDSRGGYACSRGDSALMPSRVEVFMP